MCGQYGFVVVHVPAHEPQGDVLEGDERTDADPVLGPSFEFGVGRGSVGEGFPRRVARNQECEPRTARGEYLSVKLGFWVDSEVLTRLSEISVT